MRDLKSLSQWLIETIFPRHCLGCRSEGSYLCAPCWSKIPININKFSCPFCGQPSFLGRPCLGCARRSPLAGVWVVSDYDCEILKKAVKAYKYQFVVELAIPLSRLLQFYLIHLKSKFPEVLDFDYALAVPLHYKRFLYRGFNQSQLLAEPVSQEFKWPILKNLLVKNKITAPQVALSQLKRQKNVKGVFTVNNSEKEKITNKKLLLFDDILTTGATLNECARVLKAAGAREVWGMVLAKG